MKTIQAITPEIVKAAFNNQFKIETPFTYKDGQAIQVSDIVKCRYFEDDNSEAFERMIIDFSNGAFILRPIINPELEPLNLYDLMSTIVVKDQNHNGFDAYKSFRELQNWN